MSFLLNKYPLLPIQPNWSELLFFPINDPQLEPPVLVVHSEIGKHITALEKQA